MALKWLLLNEEFDSKKLLLLKMESVEKMLSLYLFFNVLNYILNVFCVNTFCIKNSIRKTFHLFLKVVIFAFIFENVWKNFSNQPESHVYNGKPQSKV